MVIILTEGATSESQIIFTGNSFNSIVEDLGEEKVECVPIIYRTESNVGLKIEIKKFQRFLFIEENNNDPFRFYRTMRVISRLGILNTKLIGAAFIATDRTKEISMLGFSPPLSDIIKGGELRKIMMELIPEEIVQTVIERGKELSAKEKWTLKQELLAETILYDERIAKLEIKEPREIAKEIEDIELKTASIYNRIDPILESYFVWFEEELKVSVVRETINILLIEKFNFSDGLAVALGGFLAHMNYYDSLSGEAEEDSFVGALFRDRVNEITTGSIYWLSEEKGCSPDEAAKELDDALSTILGSE